MGLKVSAVKLVFLASLQQSPLRRSKDQRPGPKISCADRRHSIPTAAYGNLSTYDSAKSYLMTAAYPVVIKVFGLAAGKGVVVADNSSDADETLQDFMVRGKCGSAGASVVREEYLIGDETSILAFSDRRRNHDTNTAVWPRSQAYLQ